MITKYALLAAVSLTSTTIAMEQNSDAIITTHTPSHLCNMTEQGITKTLNDLDKADYLSLNTTSIEIKDYYAAMQKEKLNLHQLFSFDTGFSSDDRVHDLAHILLSTEEKIKKFHDLPCDAQIRTAVTFNRLAQNIESSTPYTFDQTAFEQQCATLLSGAISTDSIRDLFLKTEEEGTDA